MPTFRVALCGLVCGLLLGGVSAPAQAADPPDLQSLIERLNKVEAELKQLREKQGGAAVAPGDQKLVMLLETPCLRQEYVGAPQPKKYFVAKLMLINLTGQTLTLKRDDVTLKADGQDFKIQDVPQNLRYHSFQVGRQSFQLQNVQPLKEQVLPAGGSASTWLFFFDLPPGGNVPKLSLHLKRGDAVQTLDLTAQQRDLLNLKVEKAGPRECLGILTIGGELNALNVGSLVDELHQLQASKIGRAVVVWSESAGAVDQQLMNWLTQAAASIGRNENQGETGYPSLPSSFRELHLARLPGNEENGNYYQRFNNGPFPQRIHKTEAPAFRAALKTAFETLPREELTDAIEKGNRYVRGAALAGAAGRLPADKLPLILKYADSDDPVLQEGALMALSHFGEPEAVDKLVFYVKKNTEPLASTAIASLAGSRYATAHDALLGILKNEGPASQKTIISVLAQHPRPIWADAIFEAVNDPRNGLNVQALQALQIVGHPQIVDVLRRALQGKDTALQQAAFTILVNRQDAESETLALDATLERLTKGEPDHLMLNLLNRVKDPRATPLLLAAFEKSANKSALLQTLIQVGDQDVADKLAEKYASLQNHDKAQLLQAFQKWKSPKFKALANEALLSNDNSLINAATQGLVEQGGPDAVATLVAALDKVGQPQGWSYICNALGMLGTPEARAALLKFRDSGPQERRQYAVNGLTQMRQRSPGYQYIYQAQHWMQQKKWKEAIELFTTSLKLDPDLAEAYQGRGDAYVRQAKFAEAGKDYAKALELDPFNVQALTGVCIVETIDGKYAPAIEKLEQARAKFPNNALYLYNAACVYGRALEFLNKPEQAQVENREMLVSEYTKTAIKDLKAAVRYGFRDLTWMQQDPDLKPLHGEAEFKKLVSKNPDEPGEAPTEDAVPDEAFEAAPAPFPM